MHVILFRVHAEIREARGDRVRVVDDVHPVVDDVAGVRHPLPADHELVVGVVAERVGHAAVPAGKTGAVLDCGEQTLLLLGADRAHGPDLDDEVERAHQRGVAVDVERVGDAHVVAFAAQERREQLHALSRLVPSPAAPDHQRRSCRRHRGYSLDRFYHRAYFIPNRLPSILQIGMIRAIGGRIVQQMREADV